LVEKVEDGGLEHVGHEPVAFFCETGLHFALTVLVVELQASVVMFLRIEQFKGVRTCLHASGNLALGWVLGRPGAVGQDLCLESDAFDSLTSLVGKLLLKIFRQLHVAKHLGDLVHRVYSTLNFQLLKHLFLSFLR